jgi:hypothetical protein
VNNLDFGIFMLVLIVVMGFLYSIDKKLGRCVGLLENIDENGQVDSD